MVAQHAQRAAVQLSDTHASLHILHLGLDHDVRLGLAIWLVRGQCRLENLGCEADNCANGHRETENDLVERLEPHGRVRKRCGSGEAELTGNASAK